MNLSEISEYRTKAVSLLLNRQIAEAMVILKQMVNLVASAELIDEFTHHAMTYRYVLQYFTQGVIDPERDSVLNSMIESLLTLADRCHVEAVSPTSYDLFHLRRNSGLNVNISDAFSTYIEQCDQLAEYKATDSNMPVSLLDNKEKTECTIFNKIWSAFPTTENDDKAIRDAMKSSYIPDYFKSMIVSALTLGLICYYDSTKLLLLTEIYSSCHNVEVQVRAIVGLLIALDIHSKRTAMSKTVEIAIDSIGANANASSDIQAVFLRLARSRNTDNVSKKMTDTIPDIMKTNPDLMNKIKSRSNPTDISDLEGNPEWQQWLEDSGITKKMEELNELQTEGNDVFITTFSKLKSYPFFQTLSNWFMPFHTDHSALSGHAYLSSGIMDLFSKAPFLCNSDKFSLALTMGSMPESQLKAMTQQFGASASGFSESHDAPGDENDRKYRNAVADKYIHDLYRFFKLFSRHKEFKPIFDSKFHLEEIPFTGKYIIESDSMNIVAEYYLKSGFHNDAIHYYKLLLENSAEINPRIFQKLGFAYQNQGENDKAIDYYKKFELACDTDLWNIKHMAMAYRALKQWDKAIEYYTKADAISPNKPGITLCLGHCLLEKGDINEALNKYFKVDFMDGKSHKAWRPIAWCSFLINNFNQSAAYYKRIVEDDTPSAQDYLNYGHVLMCSGKITEAIDSYKRALNAHKSNTQLFTEALMADSNHLKAKGISENDIHLIADAVLMSNDENKFQL